MISHLLYIVNKVLLDNNVAHMHHLIIALFDYTYIVMVLLAQHAQIVVHGVVG